MPDWVAEYAALSAVDAATLPPEDVERFAVAAVLLGHDDESVRLRERAFEAYLERGRHEDAASCAFWLVFHLDNHGEHAQASGWVARLARLVPDDPRHRLAARLRQRQAVLAMFSGDAATALPIFEECGALAGAIGDLDGFVLGGLGRGRCLAMLGRRAESAEVYDEVMVHVVAGRVDPQVTGLAYCAIVAICMEWFDLRRAQEWTQRFSAWASRETGMVAYRGTCLVHRAEILQLHGAWPEASAEAASACEVLTLAGGPGIGEAHYRVGELARLRGQGAAAEEAYARASACGYDVQPGLGLLRLAQGRRSAAVAGLDRALAEEARPRQRALLLTARIEVALTEAQPDPDASLETARALADQLAALASHEPADYLAALAEHAEGAVLLAQGDPAAALPHLRHAWTLWHRCDAPYESARARALVARACGLLGDEDACRMELAAARAVFEELGAAPDLACLCGDDARRDDPLTPREREVLRVLATGASNRAIADRLVLSERTVARHVSNIFTKLELSSRAGATAYAYENGLA